MAVVLLGARPSFTGLSGDTKPTDAAAGATFTELDTGLVWIWSGTAWTTAPTVADPKFVTELAVWGAMLDELVKIRRLLEEANGLDANDLI